MTTTWVHRLSDIDLDARTGTCAHCGPVKIQSRGKDRHTGLTRYACATGKNDRKRKTKRGEHGLNRLEARAFLEGKVCAGCGSPDVVVDHDHATGKLRGALCSRCNVALGMVDDRTDVLQNLLDYLIGSRAD